MLRKFFITVLIFFLFLIATILVWQIWLQPTPEPIRPTPSSTAFVPSFSPSPSPSPSITSTATPITVSIVSVPQGAQISVNNQVIGNAPLRYTFQTQTSYHITAEKDGFVPLVLDFTPVESSLRLPLVAINSLSTFMAKPNTISPTPNLPAATPVAFPLAYSLNNHSLPTQEFIYTPVFSEPSAPPSSLAQPLATSSTSTNQPSEEEIQQYQEIINRYTGLYATDPNDTAEQGTPGEHVIIISDRHFYPAPLEVFVAFKPRFVNTTSGTCTLKAETELKTIIGIGTMAPNQDLIFHPSPNLNGIWQFWCQERPSILATIQFFS